MTQRTRTRIRAASAAAAPDPPAAGASSLEIAAGSPHLLASAEDAVRATASKPGALARRIERSFRPPATVSPRAAATLSTAEVAPYAPPAQTRPPLGGATAGASGGLGSPAPPVAAAFAALVVSLAAMLLARFSLDLASWRSTLLASRLEHPG